jgi:tetratricopeptide (TPR) repeat protein
MRLAAVALWLVIAASGAASGVAAFAGCGSSRSEMAAVQAMKYLPAILEATHVKTGDPRTAKLRIYADSAVRALPHWKDDITDQVDYASQLLQPLIGVRLAIESIKDWERTGDPHAALRELAELDKAEDVTWVVGYVAPGDAASTAMTELGDAQPLGRYLMVRAWADKPEIDALAGKLPDPKSADRLEVINAHRRHKQTVVLLHMLATTLGAIAEVDTAWIQHVSYSPTMNTFANRTRDLLQIAADGRMNQEASPAIARRLLESIEKSDWGGWIPTSHDEVVAQLRNIVDADRAGQTFAEVPPAAYDEFKRISDFAKGGHTQEALSELENLLTAYPGNAPMHELRCEIMLGKPGVTDKATRAACDRVSELAPGDPTVHFAVGEALIRAGDLAGARAELAKAEATIGNLPTGAADAWRRLIGIYSGLGSLTWTEDAATKAKLDKDPTAAQAAATRARYGIPRGARFVAPDQEMALVAAVRAALNLIYANKYGDAEHAIASAEKKWPGAPGLVAARCDLAFRTGQIETAQATCRRAVAIDPNESWALYLLGVMLLREPGTTSAGIDKLKAAIAVDPDLGQAWRTLGKAYARAGNKAALDQLATAYASKFGQTLPP